MTQAAARPLSGHWFDDFALIYDEAYERGGALPPQIDALSIPEVAAILGRNRVEQVEREAWPEDAPSIRSVRRQLAMSEGRPVPKRDDPIDDVEYAALIAQVKGGKRTDLRAV